MKKYRITAPALLAIVLLTVSACTGKKAPENNSAVQKSEQAGSAVTVDLEKSSVHWKGEMLGVYSHEGQISLKSASLEMTGDQVSGGSFIADMTSIVATDENYAPAEGRTKEKLVGHLSAPDFFDVATYPEASFEITSVQGDVASGILTIRGISNEESVTNISVVAVEGGETVSGELTFDRKKYDVSYDVAMKDMVLSKDILLTITLFVSR